MRELHVACGAVFGHRGATEIVRHYGDPAGEYRAAVERAAMANRSHRTRLRITGKAPAQMLSGVITGVLPEAPRASDEPADVRFEYSLVLTPKGRIVSDLRLLREPGDEESFLMDVPVAGAEALREHFAKFLPPRFARSEDVTAETGMITVIGPEAADRLAAVADHPDLRADRLEALEEGGGVRIDGADGWRLIVRTGTVDASAFDLLAERETIRTTWSALAGAGVRPVGHGVVQTLRVEAGRPALGDDMGKDTIPYEAGVVDRAVDHAKGCYTGQEVIVRIRDRGKVNRHLRGLKLGDVATPASGAELYGPDSERSVGAITTAVESPRAAGAIALAYVRREIEPGGVVRVGSPDGPEAEVAELEPGWSR